MVVRHKLTGKVMTVKKNYGAVSSCRLAKEDETKIYFGTIVDVAICDNNNLEHIDSFEIKFAKSE